MPLPAMSLTRPLLLLQPLLLSAADIFIGDPTHRNRDWKKDWEETVEAKISSVIKQAEEALQERRENGRIEVEKNDTAESDKSVEDKSLLLPDNPKEVSGFLDSCLREVLEEKEVALQTLLGQTQNQIEALRKLIRGPPEGWKPVEKDGNADLDKQVVSSFNSRSEFPSTWKEFKDFSPIEAAYNNHVWSNSQLQSQFGNYINSRARAFVVLGLFVVRKLELGVLQLKLWARVAGAWGELGLNLAEVAKGNEEVNSALDGILTHKMGVQVSEEGEAGEWEVVRNQGRHNARIPGSPNDKSPTCRNTWQSPHVASVLEYLLQYSGDVSGERMSKHHAALYARTMVRSAEEETPSSDDHTLDTENNLYPSTPLDSRSPQIRYVVSPMHILDADLLEGDPERAAKLRRANIVPDATATTPRPHMRPKFTAHGWAAGQKPANYHDNGISVGTAENSDKDAHANTETASQSDATPNNSSPNVGDPQTTSPSTPDRFSTYIGLIKQNAIQDALIIYIHPQSTRMALDSLDFGEDFPWDKVAVHFIVKSVYLVYWMRQKFPKMAGILWEPDLNLDLGDMDLWLTFPKTVDHICQDLWPPTAYNERRMSFLEATLKKKLRENGGVEGDNDTNSVSLGESGSGEAKSCTAGDSKDSNAEGKCKDPTNTNGTDGTSPNSNTYDQLTPTEVQSIPQLLGIPRAINRISPKYLYLNDSKKTKSNPTDPKEKSRVRVPACYRWYLPPHFSMKSSHRKMLSSVEGLPVPTIEGEHRPGCYVKIAGSCGYEKIKDTYKFADMWDYQLRQDAAKAARGKIWQGIFGDPDQNPDKNPNKNPNESAYGPLLPRLEKLRQILKQRDLSTLVSAMRDGVVQEIERRKRLEKGGTKKDYIDTKSWTQDLRALEQNLKAELRRIGVIPQKLFSKGLFSLGNLEHLHQLSTLMMHTDQQFGGAGTYCEMDGIGVLRLEDVIQSLDGKKKEEDSDAPPSNPEDVCDNCCAGVESESLPCLLSIADEITAFVGDILEKIVEKMNLVKNSSDQIDHPDFAFNANTVKVWELRERLGLSQKALEKLSAMRGEDTKETDIHESLAHYNLYSPAEALAQLSTLYIVHKLTPFKTDPYRGTLAYANDNFVSLNRGRTDDPHWVRDIIGEQHHNTLMDGYTCTKQRPLMFDHWCDTQEDDYPTLTAWVSPHHNNAVDGEILEEIRWERTAEDNRDMEGLFAEKYGDKRNVKEKTTGYGGKIIDSSTGTTAEKDLPKPKGTATVTAAKNAAAATGTTYDPRHGGAISEEDREAEKFSGVTIPKEDISVNSWLSTEETFFQWDLERSELEFLGQLKQLYKPRGDKFIVFG